jgi:hypothetical protein
MTIIFHDFIKAGVVMTGILTDNAIVEMICNTNNDCGINEIEKFTRPRRLTPKEENLCSYTSLGLYAL